MRRPKAWIINEALASYFKRENRDQRMYRETLEGLSDVEAGRVIHGDKVIEWIESWGSDDELPPPRG
ncbi:transcriptional regulator [Granulosicoccus sp.]|nr:transcriptional regulator [Granulosicoccus sp.]